MKPNSRPGNHPRRQLELLRIYETAQACGQSMPTLHEAGAMLGISRERVRQLTVKLVARGAIEVEPYAPRGVRLTSSDERESGY